MIVEGVGIAVATLHGAAGQERAVRIRVAMEQAVVEVLAEGINDPERRALAIKDRMMAARERVKAEPWLTT